MSYNKYAVSDSFKRELDTLMKRLASPEFQVFRNYLELELDRVIEALASAEGVDRVYRLQGKHSAYKNLIDTINSHNRS